jgi:hypothetical protein
MSAFCVFLLPPNEEHNQQTADPLKVDSVARSVVDPEFAHTFADGLDIAEVA